MDKYQAAIAYIEDAVRESDEIIAECSPALQAELTEQKQHFVVALDALRAQAEREKPPVALTLEQLRERDGKPVWVQDIRSQKMIDTSAWGIVHVRHDGKFITIWSGNVLMHTDIPTNNRRQDAYGKRKLCYDRPPEVQHGDDKDA